MHSPFSKKQIPKLTKIFIFLFLVLISYAVIAQTVLIPRAISEQYDQHLRPDFKLLRAKFNEVSKSSELAVYNDPYSEVTKSRQELLDTQTLITETELTLKAYEAQANKLPSSPLAPHTESYKKAAVVREKAKDVFLQSREVIDGYKGLTNYLLEVNAARTVLKNNTVDINGLKDLNQLAGQSDIINKRANQLGGTIDGMKRIKPPAGFEAYHAALIVSFTQSQDGLRQIARGLAATDDAAINAGARTLEQGIRKYEGPDTDLFTTASTNSPVLKETSMLADKIDSLQPFLEQ